MVTPLYFFAGFLLTWPCRTDGSGVIVVRSRNISSPPLAAFEPGEPHE